MAYDCRQIVAYETLWREGGERRGGREGGREREGEGEREGKERRERRGREGEAREKLNHTHVTELCFGDHAPICDISTYTINNPFPSCTTYKAEFLLSSLNLYFPHTGLLANEVTNHLDYSTHFLLAKNIGLRLAGSSFTSPLPAPVI